MQGNLKGPFLGGVTGQHTIRSVDTVFLQYFLKSGGGFCIGKDFTGTADQQDVPEIAVDQTTGQIVHGAVIVKSKVDRIDTARQTVEEYGRYVVLDDRILEKLCIFRLTGHKENTGNALADRIFDQLLFCGYIIIGTGNIQRIIRCFTLDDYAFQKFAEAAVLHVGENRTDIPGSFALQIACLGVGNIV